jgi:hypothetical protein
MSQKDLFGRLRAPLANSRSSWGSVREDGTVFLRVWQDIVRKHYGSMYLQVTFVENCRNDSDNRGHLERLKHVELIKQGASCYMIMCRAVDVDAVPRVVRDFNEDEVFRGGRLAEIDGDWWIELLQRFPVRQIGALPTSKPTSARRIAKKRD